MPTPPTGPDYDDPPTNEVQLFVHPVVLGAGRPLFDDLNEPVECGLLEHAVFEDGVTLQRHVVRSARK